MQQYYEVIVLFVKLKSETNIFCVCYRYSTTKEQGQYSQYCLCSLKEENDLPIHKFTWTLGGT